MSEVYISQMFTNLLSFRFIHIMLKVHNHSSLLGTHHTMCFSFSTTNQIKIRLYCYIEKKKFIIFPNETSPKSPKTVLNESWSQSEMLKLVSVRDAGMHHACHFTPINKQFHKFKFSSVEWGTGTGISFAFTGIFCPWIW